MISIYKVTLNKYINQGIKKKSCTKGYTRMTKEIDSSFKKKKETFTRQATNVYHQVYKIQNKRV